MLISSHNIFAVGIHITIDGVSVLNCDVYFFFLKRKDKNGVSQNLKHLRIFKCGSSFNIHVSEFNFPDHVYQYCHHLYGHSVRFQTS